MKKLIMSVLAMAALASCEQATENILPEPTPENNLVPIELRAKVLGMEASTKAEITAFDGKQNIGIYALEEDKTSDPSTFPWVVSPYYHATDITINGTAFTFTTQIYYPLNGNKVQLYAYYPIGTETPPADKTAAKIGYNIDGTMDILYGEVTSGSLNDAPPATGEIEFKHKLAKVDFKVKVKENGGFTADAYKVSTIKITTPTTASLDMGDGSITFSGDAQELTAFSGTPETKISTNPTATAIGTMMIKPAAEYTISVAIVNVNDSNDTKTFTTKVTSPAAGYRHTVTLAFSKTEITPTANLVDWGYNQADDKIEELK